MVRPGRVIGGRYHVVEALGAGGMGRVWKAHDGVLGMDVAIKEVRLPVALSETEQAERLRRAEREARNAARLRDHPNIVGVHDVVRDNDVPWMVMQLVDGTSLQDHLDAHGPLSVDRAANVATALLRALAAAHDAGITHRDIKPGNIMLATNGEILLTDFGIAVHQDDTALTGTGAFIGSVEYIAPERALGQDGKAASDLFSLGVTLYQSVEGVSPFRRDTPAATLTAVLSHQPPPPEHAGRLAPLITQLLDKDPDQRPTLARALALTDVPQPTAPLPPIETGRSVTSTAPNTPELWRSKWVREDLHITSRGAFVFWGLLFLGIGIYLAVMDRQSSWSALPLNAAIVGGIVFGLAALLDSVVTRPVAMWTLWLVGLGVSITVFWPYLS
ncbi:serine/threonine-protein kinase [Streptomyces diastatochromogenes]|uniref:serine/threonine-protein kinase n=1 Tax=Streptomyces diastatochromogenes TaxID=42236 RepID=UPI0036B4E20A